MTTIKIRNLEDVLDMAKSYHDSPATKALSCGGWRTCSCGRAMSIKATHEMLLEELQETPQPRY